jgi:DNA mismatch endonuclease, patch repair protein
MHPKAIIGCPDFYFPQKKLAIFVDGCFWHACTRCGHVPKTRSSFWQLKFKRNRRRARIVAIKLRSEGVTVARFWEHEIKRSSDRVAQKIATLLFRY